MSETNIKHFRSGKWSALRGSTFSVIVDGNKFIGTYCTSDGRPKPEDLFFCTGMINEELIGIVVAWKGYSSLTTWCAHHEIIDDRECIKAVWHYGRMYEDKHNTIPIDNYRLFNVGQSLFFWNGELTTEEEESIRKYEKEA